MTRTSFSGSDLQTLGEALDVAEDRIDSFYKLSLRQWRRCRFDIKTLNGLNEKEIAWHVFALLNKHAALQDSVGWGTSTHDTYVICVQDHQILEALDRDKSLSLLAILVYVFTHELIHVVRFSTFDQRFEVSGPLREKEETFVHAKTFEILNDVAIPNLDYVLEAYRNHRVFELGNYTS
jgi:hypothetical protein